MNPVWDQKNKDERESKNKNTSSPISTWSGLFKNCMKGKAIEIETEKQEVDILADIPVEEEETELEEQFTFSSLLDFKLLFSEGESIKLSETNNDESYYKCILNYLGGERNINYQNIKMILWSGSFEH